MTKPAVGNRERKRERAKILRVLALNNIIVYR